MLIPCPVCGPRDHAEFTYGGDATIVRPGLDATDEGEWTRYVYERENPRGPHDEYWHHVHGCRAWMTVRRDTQTHQVAGAKLIGPWSFGEPG